MDPFVLNTRESIVPWATVVWGKIIPVAKMQLALAHWEGLLARSPRPWSKVVGPVGAFAFNLPRLGWTAYIARF